MAAELSKSQSLGFQADRVILSPIQVQFRGRRGVVNGPRV